MLVGDQDAVHIPALQVDIVQSLLDALVADPRVHQNMGFVRPYVNAVAAAAARNAYHSHIVGSSAFLSVRRPSICRLVSSKVPLLSILRSQNASNSASPAWLSIIARDFSSL